MEDTDIIKVAVVSNPDADYSEHAKKAAMAGSITLIFGVAGAMLADSMVARMQKRRAMKMAAEKIVAEANDTKS